MRWVLDSHGELPDSCSCGTICMLRGTERSRVPRCIPCFAECVRVVATFNEVPLKETTSRVFGQEGLVTYFHSDRRILGRGELVEPGSYGRIVTQEGESGAHWFREEALERVRSSRGSAVATKATFLRQPKSMLSEREPVQPRAGGVPDRHMEGYGAAGDILIWHRLLAHTAGWNRSPRIHSAVRRALPLVPPAATRRTSGTGRCSRSRQGEAARISFTDLRRKARGFRSRTAPWRERRSRSSWGRGRSSSGPPTRAARESGPA